MLFIQIIISLFLAQPEITDLVAVTDGLYSLYNIYLLAYACDVKQDKIRYFSQDTCFKSIS